MTIVYFCDSCHLVKGWVEVAFVNWGFLFLHSLLSKHQPDFYVGIWKPRFSFYLHHSLKIIYYLKLCTRKITRFSIDVFRLQVSRLQS